MPLFGYRFDGYWRVLDTHAGLAEGPLRIWRDPRRASPRSTIDLDMLRHDVASRAKCSLFEG